MKVAAAAWIAAVLICGPSEVAFSQNGECGTNGETLIKAAYPSANKVSEHEFHSDGFVIVSPGGRLIDEDPHAMVCHLWPSQPQYLLVAVPLIHEQNPIDLVEDDLDLLVVENTSREVKARLRLNGFISEDAIALHKLAFDTAPYRLFPGRIAFGLRTTVENNSRYNPFPETNLGLYDFHDGKLTKVMDGLVVDRESGEWNDGCTGDFSEIHRTLSNSSEISKGAAQLIIRSRENERKEFWKSGKCVETNTPSTTPPVAIRYDGREYVFPEGWKAIK